MYDVAKRSLAFTVATGGLLLSGPGFAPLAEAAVAGSGSSTGPEPASAAAGSHADASSALSVPLSLREASSPTTPAAGARAAGSGGGASADSVVSHSGGLLSGNSVQIPINLGLDLCGTNVLALAVQDVVGATACSSAAGTSATSVTDHSGGVLSGNTVQLPVNVPILACGTTVAVAATDDGSAPTLCGTIPAAGASAGAGATAVSSHSGGLLSGNIVQAPVNVPVDLCGTSVAAASTDSVSGGADCSAPAGTTAFPGAGAAGFSDHSGGIGSGLIVQTPINVPVNACGNHVGAAETDSLSGPASCVGAGSGTFAAAGSIGSGGIASGDTVQAPVDAPVDVCGNTVEVAGTSNLEPAAPVTCGELPGQGGSHTVSFTGNSGGIGSGDTVSTPIAVPVQACGDVVSAATTDSRTAGANCSAGTSTSASTTTTHSGGVGSGTSVGVAGGTPILACGLNVPVGSSGNDADGAACGHQPQIPTPPAPPAPPGSPVTPPAPPVPPGTPGNPGTPGTPGTPTVPAPPAPPADVTPPAVPAPPAPPAPSTSQVVPPPIPQVAVPTPAPVGQLAKTGDGDGFALALAGSTLLAGLGLRGAGRHRTR